MASTKSSPYQILLGQHITEKAAVTSSLGNCAVFKVHPDANKSEIKLAVEKVFEVKVDSVRTSNVLGKLKKVGKRVGRRKNWKKAYVKLSEGSTIDLFEGL